MKQLINSNSIIEEQFICWKCFNFPKIPLICIKCLGIQCSSCQIAFRQYQQARESCLKCNCEHLIQIDQITQFVYDHVQKQCEVCLEYCLLPEYQNHIKQCQMKEKQMIDYFKQKETFDRMNFKRNHNLLLCEICNQIPINPYLQQRNKKLRCQICLQVDNATKFRMLDEESILMFNNCLMQCKKCLIIDNYFQMQYHQIQCKLLLVGCDCGWLGQKVNYKLHITECVTNLIEKLKSQQMSKTFLQLLLQQLDILPDEEKKIGKKRFRLCAEFNHGEYLQTQQESSDYMA